MCAGSSGLKNESNSIWLINNKTLHINAIMLFDFHSHSTCSDGVLAPQELMEKADALGLNFLAITDHDTLDALD